MKSKDLHIIIVAGGTGSRFGATCPKQYCLLQGRPVVMHAIDRLRCACPDAKITLVISPAMAPLWADLCREHDFASPTTVAGGTTRWESVRNALLRPDALGEGLTLIHDGARPLVQPEVVTRMIERMEADDAPSGLVAAVPVVDSLREINADDAKAEFAEARSQAVDRSRYVAVQTPQIFDTAKLLKAYSLPYRASFTDDASVMEAAGYSDIGLAPGSPATMKITHPADLKIAEIYLSDPVT